MITNVYIICFQVTEINWKPYKLASVKILNCPLYLLFWLWFKLLVISITCESIEGYSGCAMNLIATIIRKSFLNPPRYIFIKWYFNKSINTLITFLKLLLHLVYSENKEAQIFGICFTELRAFLLSVKVIAYFILFLV